MHIAQIYLTSYSDSNLPEGYLTIIHEGQDLKITFSEQDRASIHEICLAAYRREQAKLSQTILDNAPTIKFLAAPKDFAEVAEFTVVEPDEIEGAPF